MDLINNLTSTDNQCMSATFAIDPTTGDHTESQDTANWCSGNNMHFDMALTCPYWMFFADGNLGNIKTTNAASNIFVRWKRVPCNIYGNQTKKDYCAEYVAPKTPQLCAKGECTNPGDGLKCTGGIGGKCFKPSNGVQCPPGTSPCSGIQMRPIKDCVKGECTSPGAGLKCSNGPKGTCVTPNSDNTCPQGTTPCTGVAPSPPGTTSATGCGSDCMCPDGYDPVYYCGGQSTTTRKEGTPGCPPIPGAKSSKCCKTSPTPPPSPSSQPKLCVKGECTNRGANMNCKSTSNGVCFSATDNKCPPGTVPCTGKSPAPSPGPTKTCQCVDTTKACGKGADCKNKATEGACKNLASWGCEWK
jgi:hypothetical protein